MSLFVSITRKRTVKSLIPDFVYPLALEKAHLIDLIIPQKGKRLSWTESILADNLNQYP